MRRLTIVLILLVIGYSSIYSQDLLITKSGDTLNCNITKVKSEYIYFTFKHDDEVRNTLLPLKDVITYQHNYYGYSEVPEDKTLDKKNFKRWRLAGQAGFSYRTGKLADNIPAGFEDYIRELKSGYHYGLDFTFFITEPIGIGLKYTCSKSANSMNNVTLEDPWGETNSGTLNELITMSFYGPSFTTRLISANKTNAFLLSLSIGYLDYNDSFSIVNDYTYNGNTVGLVWDMAYDIGISDRTSLGIMLSLTTGSLSELELSNGINVITEKREAENYENLSRIDLSLGLRFGL